MNEVKRPNPTSHTYFSQRLRLHYLDWGNAEAEHLLLVHGSQDHCHNWDWTSEALCDDYHVIVPDLRGHGDSEWCMGAGYNNMDYVYDVNQLTFTEELDKVHVIGHSMGGTIASLFAGVFPEKVASLVLIEGVGGFWYKDRDTQHPGQRIRDWINDTHTLAGRTPRKYEDIHASIERMQTSNPHLSEERARQLTIHGSNRNEDGTYSWKFDNYSHSRVPYSIPYDDMVKLWESITCPVLIINAKDGFDHRIGQDDTLRHFKNVELIEVEDAGHWLHHDQFDQYMDHISSFLKKHAG